MEKKKGHKGLFIFITIVCLLLTIIGKLLSFGLSSFMYTILGIIPVQLILFTMSGILYSINDNKNKYMNILYIFLCLTSLIYSFTFVDVSGPGVPYSALNLHIINSNLLKYISYISFISNFILSIVLISLTSFFTKK